MEEELNNLNIECDKYMGLSPVLPDKDAIHRKHRKNKETK